MQNDICAVYVQFYTVRRLFSHSSTEGGMFVCAHLKSQFKMYDRDFVSFKWSNIQFT